jgi:regulation of enolase protein 1 (concanavalin A-like superfamily)
VYNAGGSVNVFAASVSGGVASVKVASTLSPSPSAPFWLRVKRTGSTWLFTYSRDGVTFVTAGSFTFAMTVAKVGPYAGNAGSPPPAWTATVDYFFNTAAPITPEDGGSGTTTTLTNDDFSGGSLNPGTWTFVNPGGGSSQSMDGQHAVISVPGGASHDPASSGNGAPRVMQTIQNAGLSLDAKFDSSVSAQFQEQGVVVEQDSTHYVYAAIVQNYFETQFVVKTVSGGTVTNNVSFEIYNKPSIVLRVARSGNSWAFGYSYDGMRWTAAATLNLSLTVARVRRQLRRRVVARVHRQDRLLRQLDGAARHRRRRGVARGTRRARHQPLVRIERDVRHQGPTPAMGERARRRLRSEWAREPHVHVERRDGEATLTG